MSSTDLVIRLATDTDSPGIANVQLHSWHTMFPDAGIDATAYLAEFTLVERAADWYEQFAEDRERVVYVALKASSTPDEIIGFVHGRRDKDPSDQYECELGAIHILPDYRRQGIGRQLIARFAQHFQRQGCESLWLSALTGNQHARKIYERLGGQLIGQKTYMIGKNEVGIEISEVMYGWPSIDDLNDHLRQLATERQ